VEIGEISYESWLGEEYVLREVIEKAREVGADAIIIVDKDVKPHKGYDGKEIVGYKDYRIETIVIKYEKSKKK